MTQQEIDKQVSAIRKFTDDLIAQGPEACKKFLIEIRAIESGEVSCQHPWASVLGDGELQPEKCLRCGEVL